MYSNKILELFKNPMNVGGLQGANGVGKYVDPECNDCVKIYLKIDEKQIITEAHFKAVGSVGTIVCASAICSCILDCSLEEVKSVNYETIKQITGELPKEKEYTAEFAVKALNLAIEDYFSRLEKEEKKSTKKISLSGVEQEVKVQKTQKNALTVENNEEANNILNERRFSSARANFDALFEE